MRVATKAKPKVHTHKRAYPESIKAHSPRKLQADLNIRFATKDEYEHIKKAAASLDPQISLNLFITGAALKEATRVLGHDAPQPISLPA